MHLEAGLVEGTFSLTARLTSLSAFWHYVKRVTAPVGVQPNLRQCRPWSNSPEGKGQRCGHDKPP